MGAELFWDFFWGGDFFFWGAGWVCRGGSVVVGGPGAAKTSAVVWCVVCGVCCVVKPALRKPALKCAFLLLCCCVVCGVCCFVKPALKCVECCVAVLLCCSAVMLLCCLLCVVLLCCSAVTQNGCGIGLRARI